MKNLIALAFFIVAAPAALDSGRGQVPDSARTAAHKRNMMHVTLHLDSTAYPDGSQAA